jgi:hypothetical protein
MHQVQCNFKEMWHCSCHGFEDGVHTAGIKQYIKGKVTGKGGYHDEKTGNEHLEKLRDDLDILKKLDFESRDMNLNKHRIWHELQDRIVDVGHYLIEKEGKHNINDEKRRFTFEHGFQQDDALFSTQIEFKDIVPNALKSWQAANLFKLKFKLSPDADKLSEYENDLKLISEVTFKTSFMEKNKKYMITQLKSRIDKMKKAYPNIGHMPGPPHKEQGLKEAVHKVIAVNRLKSK